MTQEKKDELFMNMALKEAEKAAASDEVPVGAVIVSQDQVIAKGHNQVVLLGDVTAHAEMLAITAATNHLGAKYLQDCTLYVTLEPCPMCAGALKWAQIGRVVYGTEDEKAGFMRYGKSMLHKKTQVAYGIFQEQCASILKKYFKTKR